MSDDYRWFKTKVAASGVAVAALGDLVVTLALSTAGFCVDAEDSWARSATYHGVYFFGDTTLLYLVLGVARAGVLLLGFGWTLRQAATVGREVDKARRKRRLGPWEWDSAGGATGKRQGSTEARDGHSGQKASFGAPDRGEASTASGSSITSPGAAPSEAEWRTSSAGLSLQPPGQLFGETAEAGGGDEELQRPLLASSVSSVSETRAGRRKMEAASGRFLFTAKMLAIATFAVAFAKGLARLVQGVPEEEHFSTGYWWMATIFGLCVSLLEFLLYRQFHRNFVAFCVARKASWKSKTPSRQRWGDMMALCRPDWLLFAMAFVSLGIAAAGESVIPLLLGKAIDSVAINHNRARFESYMLYLVITAAVTGLFTGIRGSTFMITGARFSMRLRQKLFDNLMRQELGFFDATKTGEILSRLGTDTEKVSDQVTLNVNVFLRSLLQVCFTLIAMTVISWKLSVTAFVSVPLIVIFSKAFGSYIRKLAKKTQKALAEASAVAEQTISSIATIKSFAAEDEESNRYRRSMYNYLALSHYEASAYAVYAALSYTFLPYCSYCLVLYYGGRLNDEDPPEIDSGELVSFVFYLQSLFAAFNSLGNIFTGLLQAFGAADKVFEWIERKPQMHRAPRNENYQVLPGCAGELRLQDCHFAYPLRPEKPVLRGLSFAAPPGQVIALCGPSGGGKSSCVALLENFYEPASGNVTLDGVGVASLRPKWFHRTVSIVGQEPALFNRSIYENILLGLMSGEDGIHAEAIGEELIGSEGCARRAASSLASLSGELQGGPDENSSAASVVGEDDAEDDAEDAEDDDGMKIDERVTRRWLGLALRAPEKSAGRESARRSWETVFTRKLHPWQRTHTVEGMPRMFGPQYDEGLYGTDAFADVVVDARVDAPRHFVEAAVMEAAKLANAHDFISAFPEGYNTRVGEKGSQLSGGQKQRIAIARALVRKPKVLLLDEATSALDAESEATVQAAIDNMITQSEIGCIVIAHRLSTIRNANSIIVIGDGRVLEQGTHEELLARQDHYYRLVMKQMGSEADEKQGCA